MSNMFDFTESLLPALGPRNTNVFFSPYSIDMAFTAVSEGASGDTKEEMESVLPGEEDRYRTVRTVPSISTANAVWLQQNLDFFPDFDRALRKFDAEVSHADFISDADGARKVVNDWTYHRTRERIKDVLPPGSVTNLTRLVVANAIYFKDNWLKQFNQRNTMPRVFVTPEGPIQTMMMKDTGRRAHWVEEEDYAAIVLPYRDVRVDMVIVLPHVEEVRNRVEANLGGILRGISRDNVTSLEKIDVLMIPKFRLETGYNLKSPLSTLGMKTVFTDQSTLDRVTPQEPKLFVGAAFHKAFVDVDEKGTEAAAATNAL